MRIRLSKIALLFLLSLATNVSFGTTPEVDSLIQVYEQMVEPSDQLHMLNKVVHFTAFSNTKVAEYYALKHDSIANTLDDNNLIGQSKSLLGRVYFATEDYEKCTENFLKALSYAEAERDTARMASMYNNLAAIFWRQSDTINSLDFSRKALKFYTYSKNDLKVALGCTSLGTIYKDIQEYDSCKVYINKAIEYYRIAGRTDLMSRPYFILAHAYSRLEKPNEALAAIQKAKDVKNKKDKQTELVDIQILEGQILTSLGLFSKAKNALQIAEDLIEKHDMKANRRDLSFRWKDYYLKKGDYKKAYAKLEEYYDLQTEAINSERDLKINELYTKYDTEKKESEIVRLALEDELKTTQIQNQRLAMLALFAAFGGLAFLFYRNVKQQKKIEIQNELISKSLEEKDILLREIHHRVKNNLQLVSSLLGLQSRHISDPNALEAINSGKARVKSMALIHQDLYNRENLTGVNVKEYLEKLCKELIETYQVDTNKVELRTDIDVLHLDVETLIPLGLIINEVLTNSIKYAFPNGRKGLIEIKLHEQNGRLKLQIKDNGIGIQTGEKSTSSFGFKLIDTLLSQLEGEMEIVTTNGTELNFDLREYKIAA